VPETAPRTTFQSARVFISVGKNDFQNISAVNSKHFDVPLRLVRLRLKRDGTCAETRFRLSPKRTSPFKSAGTSVQSTTDSQGVRISGNNAGYIMFRGSVKITGYPLHSPVSPLILLPCVTVCHRISTGLYHVLTQNEVLSAIPVRKTSIIPDRFRGVLQYVQAVVPNRPQPLPCIHFPIFYSTYIKLFNDVFYC
jgi:hypothetical protein